MEIITPPCTDRCKIIAAILGLFICLSLRAAEASESFIYPACKSKVGAIDIDMDNMPSVDPCMFRCPPTVKTVCSNDGMTHMNECFMCKAACHNPHRPLFKVCDGRCPCKGVPHEEEMKESDEDCVGGKCDTDAEDHYPEDFGFDIEEPEAKYKSPGVANPYVLHESRGYETTPADMPLEEEDDEDLEDGEAEAEAEAEEGEEGEEWEEGDGDGGESAEEQDGADLPEENDESKAEEPIKETQD